MTSFVFGLPGRWELVLAGMALLGCQRPSEPEPTKPASARALTGSASSASPSSAAPPPPSSAAAAPAELPAETREPTVLAELPLSAYRVSIAMDETAIYLLAPTAAHRLVPGAKPRVLPLELGHGATLTREGIVFWRDEAVWEAPKRGGPARKVGALSRPPELFVAAGERFAWLARRAAGGYELQTFVAARPQTLYSTPERVEAPALVGERVYFVERAADLSWRVGRVPLTGGAPTFTAPHTGRPPAMLAASPGGLTYYSGQGFEVRALDGETMAEQVIVRDFICTPVASVFAPLPTGAAQHTYCGRVEGLFELVGSTSRRLTDNQGRLITGIAAGALGVAWLSDAGTDRLVAKLLPLPVVRP